MNKERHKGILIFAIKKIIFNIFNLLDKYNVMVNVPFHLFSVNKKFNLGLCFTGYIRLFNSSFYNLFNFSV